MKDLESKPSCCAEAKVFYSEDCSGLVIQASLPGVDKKNIDFSINSDGFCISGEREDLLYDCCYPLFDEVDPDKSVAKYHNGLLTVTAPFKVLVKGKSIEIH